MVMLAFAVILGGVTAYIWCIRGFFSALIHMICVFAAGAVAFGVYEPVANLIADAMPDRGFGSQVRDMAWGLGLALSFALSLAIFRGVIDSLLPANAQCETVADYIGGGVCGLVSGVISAGIMVISINFVRAEPDFLYQSAAYSSSTRGSIERANEGMSPWVDRITIGLYSKLSLTTLRTPDPLAVWHPSFETFPGTMRLTYDDRSRTTIRPDEFKVLGFYVVGDQAQAQPFDALTPDEQSPSPHKFSDINGHPFGASASSESDDEPDHKQGYLAGFIIKFNSKAREKTGQVIVGNGQVRLVVQSTEMDDATFPLHPIAVVTNIDDPTKKAFAHFRINADKMFTSSVGGTSDATMAFEFPVPRGYKPLALYVKGFRVDVSEKTPLKVYPDPSSRDDAIKAGEMEAMNEIGPILDENGKPVPAQANVNIESPLIVVSTSLGFMIQKGSERGLTVQQETRGWSITDGEETYSTRTIKGLQALDPKLKIDRFGVTEDRAVVKVDVTPTHRNAEFNKAYEAADRNLEPVLIDSNGNKYPAVGFIAKDSTNIKVRYMQGSPIQKLGELPAVSRSATDKELTIIFVVSNGVTLTDLKIGEESLPSDLAKKPIKAERGR